MNKSERCKPTTIDGGYGWVIVFAAFMIQFIVGGIIYTLGVLYTEFLDEFGHGKGNTAWISSLFPGTLYSIGPVPGALSSRFGCRSVVFIGTVFAATGLILSSFATSIFHLYFTLGVLSGIGFGFIILPTRVCVNRYFRKKRSFAFGIAVGGTGIGIFAFAQLVRFLINEYGWRGTILIEAGISFNVAVFGALLIPITCIVDDHQITLNKEETGITYSKSQICSRHFTFSLLKDPVFQIFSASNIFTALGYRTPYTYLPDRAELVGIDKSESAFLISVMGITTIFGRPIFGWLADQKYINRLFLYGMSILTVGISNIFNPVSNGYVSLLVYASMQGLFGGVIISLTAVVLADFIGVDRLDKGLGLLQGIQGIGYFLGPPIAGWLYDGTESYDASFYFLGCCLSLGGILSIIIFVQQKISQNRQRSHLDVSENLETIQTRF